MSKMKKMTCKVLVVSTLMLSLTTARAGLISPEQAAPTTAPAERTLLLSTLDRTDVASRLQSLGVDPGAAKERVAGMTDQEVRTLVQDLQTGPAGGIDTAGWVAIIVIALAVWYFACRR